MSSRKPERTDGGRLFENPREEVHDELAFHIEQRVREFMAEGMDEAAARKAALERIGDWDRVSGECTQLLKQERRSHARRDWLSDVVQDARFAVRGAMRAPLFSLMAIATLALGIGANAAVFGVVKSVLLDSLPYGAPDELVRITARFREAPDAGGGLSAATVHDLATRQRSFSALAASSSGGRDAVLQSDGGAINVRLVWVERDFFDALGVVPARGRTFDEADTQQDTTRALIITHAVWQDHFGGGEVLGRSMVLNSIPRTVVGVLPPDFVHPVRPAGFFLPFDMSGLLEDPVSARGSHFLELIGRRGPGVTVEQAAADVAAIGDALAQEYPREHEGMDLLTAPLRDSMVGDTRIPLLVLMASAALVLLIACANLAAAMLSRTIARRREFAVRVSLGAGRGRLVRQLLAESVMLAVAGGIAGLLLAHVALTTLRAASLDALPDYASLTIDAGALLFAFVVALLTGIAFGSMPALAVVRSDPQPVLRDESRGTSESRAAGRLRGALVAAQVALCLSLLAGAGLLTRSLWLMASAPLGFHAGNALTFSVPLSGPRYSEPSAITAFNDQLTERIAALPGVTEVATATFLPTRVANSNGIVVLGRATDPNLPPFILTNGVSDNFFDVMHIPVVAGRTFQRSDDLDSPPVAVVSETMARQFWPDGNAVGARFRMGPDPEAAPIEVVGIVRDVRSSMAETRPEPMLYRSQRQGWWPGAWIVRTAGDPLRHSTAVRAALQALDPTVPMADVSTMRDVLADNLADRRLPMLLMLAFGGLALLLACIGIYALFANMAIAREREFGVRLALGSSPTAVAGLLLRQGALWMGLGLAGGALGVYAVSRALGSLVYGIAPLDRLSITLAVAALLLSATLALAVPLRRATRADPLSVLR